MLNYASQTKTSLTRIMLDNMVVPLPDRDVDVSMLREAVALIGGRFETEVSPLFFSVITSSVQQKQKANSAEKKISISQNIEADYSLAFCCLRVLTYRFDVEKDQYSSPCNHLLVVLILDRGNISTVLFCFQFNHLSRSMGHDWLLYWSHNIIKSFLI